MTPTSKTGRDVSGATSITGRSARSGIDTENASSVTDWLVSPENKMARLELKTCPEKLSEPA
jgi:hypothetical protein